MDRRFFCVLGLGFLFDQVTKYIAESQLFFLKSVKVFPPVLSFDLVHNYGAAYGILQHKRLFLLIVSVVVICVCILFSKHIISSSWSYWALCFLLIGTLGNFGDRLVHGFVIDFINIRIFPVFNVADMCIDIGIVLFLCELFFKKENDRSST